MRQENFLKRDDPEAWARLETIVYAKRRIRLYGVFALTDLLIFILVLKGMPLHTLWPFVGWISGIALVCLLTVTGFHAVALVGEYASRNQN